MKLFGFLCSMKRLSFIIALLLVISSAVAQDNVTTFGLSYKPIFPSSYFRTGPIDFADKNINFQLTQRSGFSGGGLVRHGISNRISFETGILFTKRNYDLKITDTTFSAVNSFKIIGYEIPLNALVFVQLGQRLWMNAALGGSIDLFPSDIYTDENYYRHYSARNRTANTGVNAMLGTEYRTKNSGYIYLGAAYHRSMNYIYRSIVEYYPNRTLATPPAAIGITTLQGDYFTFDIRYYFHEAPKKAKKKKKN